MTLEESKKIITKIKMFRPYFQTGNSPREEADFLKEWHKVLEPYDYEDVDQKLDEYFRNGDNFGRIPEIHYIVKFLKTHKEKTTTCGFLVRCPLCKKQMPMDDLDIHYDRCSSVNYIYNKTNEYFHQQLDKEKLYQMSQSEFDKKYLEFITLLKEKVKDSKEKIRLENLVKMLNGEKVDLTIEKMI